MAQIVVMPKLGNTVESCIIVAWKVEVGAKVAADTMICEIETDKATMEVPAGVEGILLKRLKEVGDDVPVLEPIALVGTAGEASDAGFTSPRARTLAAEKGMPLSAVASGSGPGGRIIERDVKAALAAGPGTTASARDLETMKALWESGKHPVGTGLGGRLTAADLQSADLRSADLAPVSVSPAVPTVAPAAIQVPSVGFPGPYSDTPIRSIRKIIADRMLHSMQSSAQLTFNSSAPAERLLGLRSRFKNTGTELGLLGITIGDLVAYAAAKVLEKHTKLNAYVVDGTLRCFGQIHLGLAVDTPRGLMVPTIRNATALTLREFSALSKKLAADSLSGSVSPDLLSGGTFTVTNLGAFGIESFTPILNEPQTAILGVDNIVPRPTIAADGKVGAEMRIGFSLTVDHRVVDGADAARYLKALTDYIANIDLILLG